MNEHNTPTVALRSSNVLLGATGSVASILVPTMFTRLRQLGYHVKVVATSSALYFFDPAEIRDADSPSTGRDPRLLIVDEDEWPGRSEGRRYQRGDPVLHIELRRWADLLLIAPLDAHTLAKLALGLTDNCLTCVWRAWEPSRPIVLAPAMNTLMWEHPATVRHLRQLAEDVGIAIAPHRPWAEAVALINTHCPHLQIVPPQEKRLACADVGVGALATPDDIVAVVQRLLPVQQAAVGESPGMAIPGLS